MSDSSALAVISNLMLILMLWATGLSIGMRYTVPQVLAPLKNTRLIVTAVVVNAIAMPLSAWGLTTLFRVPSGFATGVMLCTFAMAAPIALKIAQTAHGDLPLAIALVVLLQALNILTIPIWGSLLFPGGASVNALQIAGSLIMTVLAPLAVGLFVKARYPQSAASWMPSLTSASNYLLIAVIGLTLLANWSVFGQMFGTITLVASLGIVLAGLVLGYYLGGRTPPEKRTNSLVTGARATGPAMFVAQQSFASNPDVLAGVVGLGILSFLPLVVALEWGKKDARAAHVTVSRLDEAQVPEPETTPQGPHERF